MTLNKYGPWLVGALALAWVASSLRPATPVRGMDVDAFGRLPVLEGGRIKPVDSVARNSLLMIRSQMSFRFEEEVGGQKQARTVRADEWMLDLLFRPEVADAQPAFVINDPDVLSLIGQKLSQTNRYFAFREIRPFLAEIQAQAAAAEPIDAKQRNRFQGAVVNLYQRLDLYLRLQNTVQVPGGIPLAAELAAVNEPSSRERQSLLASAAYFRPLPPQGERQANWRSVGEALRDAAQGGAADPGLASLARVGAAWRSGDVPGFNAAVAELRASGVAAMPAAVAQGDHEIVFNRADPFYAGMVIYIAALLLVFASWLWQPELLRRSAFALLLVGSVVHTAGLVSRTILQGRPPVTNLYSSAVFVGWGAVVLGVFIERMYRKGFGTVVAAACGFGTLLVAHHLTGDGDTMEMMRAVLDSNFWLGTHVITITIGYSGTFLAGAIAIAWALRKHFAPTLLPATDKTLVSMAYGVICFALFFSFIGTVLGGIWADQSWGRFWGWDPKENGALLIVLWNAIILHARWGGYVRDRGIMTMAIFGNVITALSWFGVNMLGVGLHSYGFMDKAFWSLSAFCASQLILMGVALAPRRFWRGAGGGDSKAAQAAGPA
jgi:ABC-type transport system involved in cytochrome c biogenesis permease subunit